MRGGIYQRRRFKRSAFLHSALTPEVEPRRNADCNPEIDSKNPPHIGGGGSGGCRLKIAITCITDPRLGVTLCVRGLCAAMSEFLVSLLGERLVNSEKAEVDVQALGAKLSLVGLFFGCSLNAPCKQFNGSLCEFYNRFKKTSEHKDKLEIVFISSDQDQKHWQDFVQEMPWPALPFKDRHKKVRVAMKRHARISDYFLKRLLLF